MSNAGKKTAISPTRAENYPEWYQQVIKASDLAEMSSVRGCMVIKPWGYGIWENIRNELDRQFKATGHRNAYFPLLVPLSYLEKEAQHVDGFAKECAVVTHHRLEADGEGGLRPAGKLEEPLIIRPTSETIIGDTYSRWVQSYRDLPILINQWANVFRWEMRTRLFLRTAEFLWQEGHTVHATEAEAREETLQMLDVYAKFSEDFLAMPVIKGEKTADERFPGADNTYTIEAMMQDRKALQAGTSHYLGQNFSKAQEIKFTDQQGAIQYAFTTSWGVSTRLIGGMIMTHSDDDGLVLPPKIAPAQAVILPIYRNDEERGQVLEYCANLRNRMQAQRLGDVSIEVELDDRDIRGGEKTWYHVKRGVPLRIEVGPRDIAKNAVAVSRRDQSTKDKQFINLDEFITQLVPTLEDMQANLFNKAKAFRDAATKVVSSLDDFVKYFKDTENLSGGFAVAFASDDPAVRAKIKELKVTARCIPLVDSPPKGSCIFTGKANCPQVVFAKAY